MATQRHPRTLRPYAKAVHSWAFARLYEYVTYKAESEGVLW